LAAASSSPGIMPTRVLPGTDLACDQEEAPGSLEGGAHLQRFMRLCASPAAHAHAHVVGDSCARVWYASPAAHPHARIASGARARARAHRRQRTRTLIAGSSCSRVWHLRCMRPDSLVDHKRMGTQVTQRRGSAVH
jgi:hypothetical protein